VLTLVALLVLTVISWAISNVELGWASTAVALAIAVVKAGLVVYWFMELPLASTPARIVIIVTISFIALLCGGAVADIGLR
jgi:cytochrome c oxidase subunit 4